MAIDGGGAGALRSALLQSGEGVAPPPAVVPTPLVPQPAAPAAPLWSLPPQRPAAAAPAAGPRQGPRQKGCCGHSAVNHPLKREDCPNQGRITAAHVPFLRPGALPGGLKRSADDIKAMMRQRVA